MNSIYHITFNIGKISWNKIKEIFIEINKAALVKKGPSLIGHYSLDFNEGDANLEVLKNRLNELGVIWSTRNEKKYTSKELMGFNIFILRVISAPRVYGGPIYGTKFVFDGACPKCGTGAKKIPPLYLNGSDVPNGDIFATYDSEIIVSKKIQELLNHNLSRTIEYIPVNLINSSSKVELFQLYSKTILPPMSPTSSGLTKENSCDVCGRDGYFASSKMPMEVKYDKLESGFLESDNTFLTFEHFGKSVIGKNLTESHFAEPLLIVKTEVMKIMVKQKVKGIIFEPITLL